MPSFTNTAVALPDTPISVKSTVTLHPTLYDNLDNIHEFSFPPSYPLPMLSPKIPNTETSVALVSREAP